MLRLARLTVLLAVAHLACVGSVVGSVAWVPMLASLCSSAAR